MQVASRQCLWKDAGGGTVIVVEMTPATGLYLKFVFHATEGSDVAIRWGDGGRDDISYAAGDLSCGHTYSRSGRYTVVIHGAGAGLSPIRTCVYLGTQEQITEFIYSSADFNTYIRGMCFSITLFSLTVMTAERTAAIVALFASVSSNTCCALSEMP